MRKELVKENINIALNSIKAHKLRAVLTILIIAFGIMALVGILTSIEAVKTSLNQNFSRMGANTATIRGKDVRVEGAKASAYKAIKYRDAIAFKERYRFPAAVSVYTRATGTATVKYKTEKSNPNVTVYGADESYLTTSGNTLAKGRNLSVADIRSNANVAVIGSGIKTLLFRDNENPVGKSISIGSGKYLIIGVLKEKGSSFGFSSGKSCIVPLTTLRNQASGQGFSFRINLMTNQPENLEKAIGEAEGLFRVIRQLNFDEENNFQISKSSSLADSLFENLKILRLAAVIIGIITLVGAAIGLMNIMLVSVTERTREIGIRKAIGANSRTVKNQFMMEAIVIAQLGGLVGIVFGILIGNLLGMVLGTGFIVPWIWILSGIGLCFIVALLSGIIPATKAARLDPIESLRYE